MNILTEKETRNAENKAFESYFSEEQLMLRAGTGCAEKIIQRCGSRIHGKSVAVVCGNGKNAGDGFVIAKILYCSGVKARIVLAQKEPYIAEPVKYYNDAVKSGVPVTTFKETSFNNDVLVVDCIFGIGFKGEPREPFGSVFDAVNACGAVVVSVDTPSGTNATDGSVVKAVCADYTIAVSTLKYAHILPPANGYCGDIDIIDIGIPDDCYDGDYAQAITIDTVKKLIPKRGFNSNKGSTGHLLNICGSYRMPGAAVICAKGALRSGAGLVKCDFPKSAYPLIACHLTQPVFNPLDETADGTLSVDAADNIIADLKWADAVVTGCGVGVNGDTESLAELIIKNAHSPIIIDADGINCIAGGISILQDVNVPVIITPHPGEAGRIIGKSPDDIQRDRLSAAKEIAKISGAVTVLKGADTIVTDGVRVFVNTTGNPGLAMGGTGDMLSGIIGSLAAQGVKPFDAAVSGVFLHGLCGDRAAAAVSQRGMTVDDMCNELGTLMSEFE